MPRSLRVSLAQCVAALAVLLGSTPTAVAQLRVIEGEVSSSKTIVDIDSHLLTGSIPPEHATCNSDPSNTLFGVGFGTGWTYVEDTLYLIDAGSSPNTLKTLTLNVVGCGIGEDASTGVTTGFAGLESLAYCASFPGSADYVYSQSFDGGAHVGVMVRIDLATGVGEQLGGTMATDLRITGMDCDEGGLWAVTHANASASSALYRIDPTTGSAVLVGATGIAGGVVESLAIDRNASELRLIAANMLLYEIDADTGAAAELTDGFDTLWAMTSKVPEPSSGLLALAAFAAIAAMRQIRGSRVGL